MSTFTLNFLRQFAPAVERGEKRMTIRATRKDRKVPAVGDTLRLYTGLRTRGARLLLETTASCVWRVRMDFTDRYIVIDGTRLCQEAARLTAKLDGFDTVDAFLDYFRASCMSDQFEGFAVHWNGAR